jgi:hypothetical protein
VSARIRFLPGEILDDDSGMARIEAEVDGAAVGCLISLEAAAERFGVAPPAGAADILDACREHRKELEELARVLLVRGGAVGRRYIRIL